MYVCVRVCRVEKVAGVGGFVRVTSIPVFFSLDSTVIVTKVEEKSFRNAFLFFYFGHVACKILFPGFRIEPWALGSKGMEF